MDEGSPSLFIRFQATVQEDLLWLLSALSRVDPWGKNAGKLYGRVNLSRDSTGFLEAYNHSKNRTAVLLKSGQIIVFVKSCQGDYLSIHGAKVADTRVRQFRRGFDLEASDDRGWQTCTYVALYDRGLGQIVVHQFNPACHKLESCCTDLLLSDLSGSKDLTCILFTPGFKQLMC